MKKQFFKYVIGSIIIILLFSIGINYILNPYGVFFKEYKNYYVTTPINERYIKTKYILDNPKKYNSFIFGSSRVGTLEGENLKGIGNFYNMTFSGALPQQILEILNFFIEKNINIENIILGIDDFDFYSKPEDSEYLPYKISYFNLYNKKINFFKYYLLKNPLNKVNLEYLFGKVKVKFDILDTGKWISKDKDDILENNIIFHSQMLKNKKISKVSNNRINETIKEINEIINVCKKNNINLTIIYLPLYKNTYITNRELIENSKIKLQEITSYWDFVDLNKYTTDEYYWYEESHYRPILGRKIFKRIFKEKFDSRIEEDKKFGKYKAQTNKNNFYF